VIPQAHITAWRATASWADDAQVEQDLVLTSAVMELFAAPSLTGKLALRGGTSLHKLFVQPSCRYSEDIDLVQVEPGPIGPIADAIQATLNPWLGKAKRASADFGFTLVYRFESEIPPLRPLRLKIEINTREHFALLGYHRRALAAENPWFTGKTEITTFALDELLATKLRALYQRRKGRDLFDLWLCLDRGLLDPARVLGCFGEYMKREGHSVSRAQFDQNLDDKEANAAFMREVTPLLAAAVNYEATSAMRLVRATLIDKLSDQPDLPTPIKPKTRRRRR